MNIPQVHKLSKASQLSLLAVVILLGAVFFTVNSALQNQNSASKASGGLNLLQNSSFESGTSSWYLNNSNSAASGTFTATKATAEDGNYSGQVVITKSSGASDNWYLQLAQANLPTTAGKTFTVSFWAKASANRPIESVLQQQVSPYKLYAYANSNLTTSWQEYTYTFTAPVTQNDNFLGFNLAQTTGTVWIDNVSYSMGGYTQTPTSTPVPTAKPAPTTVPTLKPTPTCAPPPVCYSSGQMICVEPYSGWCGYTPTGSPTKAPTTYPTSVIYYPTPTPTYVYPTPTYAYPTPTYAYPTPTYAYPTPTYAPTSTPVPGDTVLNFTIGLQGIGMAGDAVNPNSTGNMNPLHPTRTITATVYDAQNQLIATQSGTITFNSTTGLFQGSVDLGQGISTGLYTVKVKADQYLRAIVPGIQTITQAQTNTMPYVSLIVGDITGMNEINITDYNVLMACYSDLEPPQDPTLCGQYTVNGFSMADLNDDGAVNQYDYNLFLRELSNVNGQ